MNRISCRSKRCSCSTDIVYSVSSSSSSSYSCICLFICLDIRQMAALHTGYQICGGGLWVCVCGRNRRTLGIGDRPFNRKAHANRPNGLSSRFFHQTKFPISWLLCRWLLARAGKFVLGRFSTIETLLRMSRPVGVRFNEPIDKQTKLSMGKRIYDRILDCGSCGSRGKPRGV